MQIWLVLIVVLAAVFTQTLTGFGSGLVAMAFLPGLLGIRVSAPLVILVSATLDLVLLIRLRAAFNFKGVWRMMVASLLGIPLGVWALHGVSEKLLLPVLGLVMVGYGLYALFNFSLPRLEQPAWAYLAGFVSGLLGGSFSVNGPPAIIYGNCRRWNPDEFKSNLQGFFLVGDLFTIASHAVAGNLSHPVWTTYLWTLPVLALGVLAGFAVARFINPQLFRKLVLVLLLLMGVRFILSAFVG